MATKTANENSKNGSSAQSLVEFTLTATLLLFVMMAVMDFGLAFFSWITLRDAAQEGATYGSVYPPVDPDTTRNQHTEYGYSLPFIRARVRFAATEPVNLQTLPNSQIEVNLLNPEGSPGGDPCPGHAIQVRVTYYYHLVTPMMSRFVNNATIPVSASVTTPILVVGNLASCP